MTGHRAVTGSGFISTVILLVTVGLCLVLVPSASQAAPDTKSKLAAAEAHAEHLRASLAELRARADWTNERLAYARSQLAAAASRSISVEQEHDELVAADQAANADLAHRVRAIDQSGGTMALYAQAWTGSSITDVTSNLAALSSVLGTLSGSAADAADAAAQAAATQDRLDEKADSRADLVQRVEQLAEAAQSLVADRRQLLRDSSHELRALARKLAREREAAAAAAAAAAGANTFAGTTEASDSPYAEQAVAAALSKLGSDYVWGAEGPNVFDCSGLVLWSYAQAGLTLPRLASDQYFASTSVAVSAMQPGDLLVYAYDPTDENTIHHITMYIGNGQMVHAPHTGDVVRVVPVYYDGLFGVGRPGI